MEDVCIDLIGELVDATGTESFYSSLKNTIGHLVGAELTMVMRYAPSSRPEYLFYDDLSSDHMREYLDGIYRSDPVYMYCMDNPRPGVFPLDALCDAAERNSEYFNVFLKTIGMADDLAVLFVTPGGTAIGLVLEKRCPFASSDVSLLRTLYPLLAKLQKTHERTILALARQRSASGQPFRVFDKDNNIILESDQWTQTLGSLALGASVESYRSYTADTVALGDGLFLRAERLNSSYASAPGGYVLLLESRELATEQIEYGSALDRYLDSSFTPRERDIVRLVLLGYPTSKIADRLGLSVNTIKNHKKRLYAKLDITTERELFLQFLASLHPLGVGH